MKKFQFYSDKINLTSLQCKRILEDGGKLYEMLFDLIPHVNQKDINAKEAITLIQFFLSDHNELKEAIDQW